MRIGVDFDNTIVCYDNVFFQAALERGVIPPETPPTKLAVREYLRSIGCNDVWTELQGYVYGARMDDASAFEGVKDFIHFCQNSNIDFFIISHKTSLPARGPNYDLRQAARTWLVKNLLPENLIREKVFFESTRKEKIDRIKKCGCSHFIDDMPEVLEDSEFPVDVDRILFDPRGCYCPENGIAPIRSWNSIKSYFETGAMS